MRGALAILTAKIDEINGKLDAGIHVPSKLLPWVVFVLGSAGLLGPGVAEVARGALTAGIAAQAPLNLSSGTPTEAQNSPVSADR